MLIAQRLADITTQTIRRAQGNEIAAVNDSGKIVILRSVYGVVTMRSCDADVTRHGSLEAAIDAGQKL